MYQLNLPTGKVLLKSLFSWHLKMVELQSEGKNYYDYEYKDGRWVFYF